ncbi:GntR family transcriptional regulator [Pseudodonghicola flavimaris]|uniref:GntR family transcriptional regulator n=1 Tax=Pseudodonghicola flavimaris TaxID=3050036 RepID=A0ABT7F0T1_9RHOB|nr:GntR family transcriptional regulator [Pseudodonghicola flavimaris]MDK3018192.1 GntR family transcriptional regulator [Pseudodonghicola flavimaris]
MSTITQSALRELTADLPNVGGKKSDLIYLALKRAILFRQLPPDAQLLEQDLAGRFGCSQGTVREALLRLDDDGLVKRSGYRGTRVTETSLGEAVEMVRIRLSIERGVARKIAEIDFTPHQPQLDKVIEQMAEAHRKDDLYQGSELDRAFHCALASAAGMDLLSPLLLRCALHIHRFTLGSVEVPRQFYQEAGVDAEHRALLAELTSGDADHAERAISTHLAHVLSRWTPSLYHAVGPSVFTDLRKR